MHWQSGKGLCQRALPDRGDAKPGGASRAKSRDFSPIRLYFMLDDRPEYSGTPPGAAPGVTPNAVLESIDSGDFLAWLMRPGAATAVCDSSARQ